MSVSPKKRQTTGWSKFGILILGLTMICVACQPKNSTREQSESASPPLLSKENSRHENERQSSIIEKINHLSTCQIRKLSEGEQITFRRELSVPNCDPLIAGDSAAIGKELRELALYSEAEDATLLRQQAERFERLGEDVGELKRLKLELLNRGVIRFESDGSRVAHIGHPFDRKDDTDWLQAYRVSARRLARHMTALDQQASPACPQPACDLAIFHLAEAATLRPPLDWAFLREGESVVSPSAYAFSYFVERYAANREVSLALGLSGAGLSPDQFLSSLRESDQALVFQNVLPGGVRLSLSPWRSRTEYPYVVPLLLIFREAQGVLEQIRLFTKSDVREIHFEDFQEPVITLTSTGAGQRLSLRILKPPASWGDVDQVRARLYQDLTRFLRTRDLTR